MNFKHFLLLYLLRAHVNHFNRVSEGLTFSTPECKYVAIKTGYNLRYERQIVFFTFSMVWHGMAWQDLAGPLLPTLPSGRRECAE